MIVPGLGDGIVQSVAGPPARR